jgi:hypothetical protein
MQNYYDELGITRNATNEKIIDAVKKLVKLNNLENFTDPKERQKAQEKLKIVKLAYESLKDENKRFEYDLLLDEQNGIKSKPKKKSHFKLFTGLFLGTVAMSAGGTAYLMKLDCSNIRNIVDSTVCEKTKPIREIFGSTDVAPPVVVTAELANQTPSETPVETAPEPAAVTNEPTPVSKEPDVKNTEPVNVQVNVAADNSINAKIPVVQTVKEITNSTPIASQIQPAQPVVQQPTNTGSSPAMQTVIVEGVGTTPQDAAQNAAQNALTNVVGTFIDANTMLQKRTLINDGIKSETKNISKDIKDYSQGSIKSFEILETKQESGLFRVNAKVTVRNENFSVYIQQISHGEANVDRNSLIAIAEKIENEKHIEENQKTFEKVSLEIEKKQQENANAILRDSIIKPLVSGEANDIFVGKPMAVSDAIKSADIDEETKVLLKVDLKNQNQIIFKVTFKLKPAFVENMNKTLKAISIEQKNIDLDDYLNSDVEVCEGTLCLEMIDKKNSRIANFFLIKPKNDYSFYGIHCYPYMIGSMYDMSGHYMGKNIMGNIKNGSCYSDKKIMKIELKDLDNLTLMIRNIEQAKFIANEYKNNSTSTNVSLITKSKSIFSSVPWLLIRKSDDLSIKNGDKYIEKIFNEDSVYVLLNLDADMIKKMDKITVTLDK